MSTEGTKRGNVVPIGKEDLVLILDEDTDIDKACMEDFIEHAESAGFCLLEQELDGVFLMVKNDVYYQIMQETEAKKHFCWLRAIGQEASSAFYHCNDTRKGMQLIGDYKVLYAKSCKNDNPDETKEFIEWMKKVGFKSAGMFYEKDNVFYILCQKEIERGTFMWLEAVGQADKPDRTVKVYDSHLDSEHMGDFVRCAWCDNLMLIGVGEERCPSCNSENLAWACEKKDEIDVIGLVELGYFFTHAEE